MAEKLSITIALEGGKAIEQQLEGIGKAGQKAFGEIEQAAAKVGGFKNLKPEEVTQKLKDLGIVGTDAFKKIQDAVASASNWERVVGAVASVEKGFSGLVAAAGSFARALGPIGAAAGTIGVGIVKVMGDAATAINKVDAAAIKAGISIEKFSQFKKGLEGAGFSQGAIGSGIEAITSAMDKANLAQNAKDFETLREAMSRGFGGQGTAEWQRLTAQIQNFGAAGDDARAKVTALGGIIQGTGIKSLGELQQRTGSAAEGFKAFVTQLVGMPDITNRNALALRDLGTTFGTEVVQGINNGTISLKESGASIDALVAKYPALTQASANAAITFNQETNKMKVAWDDLKTTLGEKLLTQDIKDLEAILRGINALLKPENWAEWGKAGFDAVVGILAKLGELEVKLANLIGDMIKAFAKGFSGGGGTPGSVTPIPGNARGGLLGGRGTGTSDSNLAWVSRGEHIMPARAVKQPGVLALLEALRRSGGNLRGVMDGMGRFAGGGMVPRLPAFAAGGLVGGMSHYGTVDLRLDGANVRVAAPPSAMEQLSRLAVTRRMTSTGKKPGFIG